MTESDKWQRMLAHVMQHSERFSPNTYQAFKKLVIRRVFAENCLVFLLQYIGLKLSTLTVHPSPLWLATGTACGYLFLRGTWVLPGIWLGSFLGFYLEKSGFFLAMGCATVLTLQGLLLLWFSYRYLSPTLIFNRIPMFCKFLIYTALLTALASIMLVWICASSLTHTTSFFELWLAWWLANFNAIVIFSSALIAWDAYFPDYYALKPTRSMPILFGLLLVFTIALLLSHTLITTACLALSILLTTLMISARFGWCGAITAAFLTGLTLCFAGVLDVAFVRLLFVPLFLCINTIMGLLVAIKY